MSETETLSLVIRPWSSDDFPLLQRLLGNPEMTRYLGGPETPEQIRSRHERYCRFTETGPGCMFVIVAGPDRVSAGSIGYWEKEWQSETVWETGWSVLPEFQGQGIATQAIILVIDMARAENKHRFLHAFPSVDNAPSNAICRKAGFTLQGAYEFEYPPGSFLRCNDWRFDLSTDHSSS